MGASVRPDPMEQALAEIRGQHHGGDLDAALAEIRATPQANPLSKLPRVAPDASSALARNRENPSGDYGVLGRGVAANLLNAAQGIPGMEAFEAAAGSAGSKLTDHPLSYEESLKALRGETSAIPAALSIPEKIAGGVPLASLLPIGNAKTIMQAAKSGAKAGAGLGAADQLLAADPDRGIEDRVKRAGVGAAVGGAAGATLGGVAKGVDRARELMNLNSRVQSAPALDDAAVQQAKIDKTQNIENYDAAKAEAVQGGGTTPAVQGALDHPAIASYVEKVRARRPDASDAEVLVDVRKRAARDVRGFQAQQKRGAYDPDLEDKIDDLRSAVKSLDVAMGAPSQKPPLTMEIAPETFSVAPTVTQAERETLQGPLGTGPLSERTARPTPSISEVLSNKNRGTPLGVQGPDGPAFQLRGQSEKVAPGVDIETPGMTVQTAPAEDVGPLSSQWQGAVRGKAQMEARREAGVRAAQMTPRVIHGAATNPKKLETESLAAWLDDIAGDAERNGYTPDVAERALQSTLGAAKQELSPKLPTHDASLFGTLTRAATRKAVGLNRIQPVVNALDRRAGNPVFESNQINDVLRALGVLNTPFASGSIP